MCGIGYVFHQPSQILSDMLKFIDLCIFQIVRMENLFNKLCLCHNFWNISNARKSRYFFQKILFPTHIRFL